MKYYYDLHIHSCLSPCADDEMTPNNIVNMARLCGLDVIALADHNSVRNVRAAIDVSVREKGPLVIPAMELTTQEEIHAVALFPDMDSAEAFEKTVRAGQLKIKNRTEVFGRQLILNSLDDIVGEEENLLITATDLSIEKAALLTAYHGGILFPAHVDRASNGIISILGGISKSIGFTSVEVSPVCGEALKDSLRAEGYIILHNSDAHFLSGFNEQADNFFELDKLDAVSVLAALKRKIQHI